MACRGRHKRSPGHQGDSGRGFRFRLGEPVMGREIPSQPSLYSRCVVRATPAPFSFGHFVAPVRPCFAISLGSEIRAKTFDGGMVRTEGKPGTDSRAFFLAV